VNILFISWTRIGDAVLSTGVLHELTRWYPGARITVVCGPLAESLFANVPGLRRVIALRKRPFNAHWFALWREVVGQRWDIVVDLRRSLTAYVVRAGRRLVLGPTDNSQHRVAWLPSVIGLSAPLHPHLWIAESQRAEAAALLPDGPPVLAVAPLAARPEKTWPVAHFAALVGELTAAGGPCAGWRVLLLAGPGEDEQVAPLVAAVPAERLVRLVGHRHLLVVAAALARAAVYIGNESGLTHIAAAVGTPTLALFGPTNPKHYGPWSDKACVVEAPLRDGARPIAGLEVAAVKAAAVEMLRHLQLI
jgi:ADP-heptose:LPS heptosyltransferase